MRTYVIRRLLESIPTLFLVSLAIFIIMRVLPGDVAILVLGGREGQVIATEEQRQEIKAQLGLDKPLHQQYITWVRDLLRLELGTSLARNTPVVEEIAKRLPLTLEIAVGAWILSLLVGIPLGILEGAKRDTLIDSALRVISVAGVGLPAFLIASFVLLGAVSVFNWMPPIGYVPLWEDPLTSLQQVAIPMLALGYGYGGRTSRLTRSALLEVLRQDYVRTAYAKGLPNASVIVRHAMRNALLPVITMSGFQFGHMLGGTVILEHLFALPGIGDALISGIQSRDFPLVQATVVVVVLWFLLVNLTVDLLYGVFDPRVRLR